MGRQPRAVDVLTPTIGRPLMLAQCVDAVAAQTVPVRHLIATDHRRLGVGPMLNRLLSRSDAPWLALIADDDLMDPRHVETLLSGSGDIRYTYCRVTGRNWNPNQPFDADQLRRGNYIPATTLIRTELARELLWTEAHFEDWDFWLRALDAGASFECIPQVTWTYRFHGSNLSLR